jgi:hypothetical protein
MAPTFQPVIPNSIGPIGLERCGCVPVPSHSAWRRHACHLAGTGAFGDDAMKHQGQVGDAFD